MKTKAIPLTKGQVALIDADDFERVSLFSWCAIPYLGHWRARGSVNGKLVYMHRFIMGFPPNDVDHKNRNTLDNRKSNLRPATRSQNNGNCKPRLSKSGFKGVFLDNRKAKHFWNVCIGVGGEKYYLGSYSCSEEASLAYGLHALAVFGEFARF